MPQTLGVMMRWAVVFAPLALVSCISAKPGADAVRLSGNIEMVKGCQFLRQETVGVDPMDTMSLSTIRGDIVNKMRNAAVDAGATDIVSSGPQVSMPGPSATMTGDLYRCG